MSDSSDNWYGEDAATLGDRLAAARDAAGLSQRELAGQIGVKHVTLEAWENDQKEPRANRLQMLTGLLGVSLRWLLTGVGDGPDNPDTDVATPKEVQDILLEMRLTQAKIARANAHLGELEKQLRKALVTS